MRGHRTSLLRHAELIDGGKGLALHMSRHGQKRRYGHHAGTTDAGDHDAIGLSLGEDRQGRLGQQAQLFRHLGNGAGLARNAAHDRNEAGAKALGT